MSKYQVPILSPSLKKKKKTKNQLLTKVSWMVESAGLNYSKRALNLNENKKMTKKKKRYVLFPITVYLYMNPLLPSYIESALGNSTKRSSQPNQRFEVLLSSEYSL